MPILRNTQQIALFINILLIYTENEISKTIYVDFVQELLAC